MATPPPPRFERLDPPARAVPGPLALYVWLATTWSQVALGVFGVGLGLLALALGTGRRGDVVPALLLLGMGGIMFLGDRGRRRQRLGMLRAGRVAAARVERTESSWGAGDHRLPWSMRLTFRDPDGNVRRTSYHADLFEGLAEGVEVELFYDPETPLDTTPEGERPRVPEHRWPLLALELPRGVRVAPDGGLLRPGPLRLASVLVVFAIGFALPASALVRALLPR